MEVDVEKLRKTYYPAFCFDDGMYLALIILTSIVFIGSAVNPVERSVAELAEMILKMTFGWVGVFWVTGGGEYFKLLKKRICAGKILSSDWELILVERVQPQCVNKKMLFLNRTICSVTAQGIRFPVSIKTYVKTCENNGRQIAGYIIHTKGTKPEDGIFLPY